MIRILVVFTAGFISDATWSVWTLAIAEKRAAKAALVGALIVLIGAVSVDALIVSRWFVIPSALGGAAGTYLTVRRSAKKEQ